MNMSFLKDYIISKAQSTKDPAEYYNYVSLNILCGFSAIPHIIYAMYFGAYEVSILYFLNILSCLIYLFSYIQIIATRYKLAVILIFFEISASSIVTVLLVGPDSYYQCFILIATIALFSIINFLNWEKFLLLAIFYLCFLLTFCLHYFFPPAYPECNTEFFKFFNLNITFLSAILIFAVDKIVYGLADTTQQEKIEELKLQAYLDPLTKIYNRRYASIYFESIKKSKDRRQNICMVMVDIDDFKKINDTFTHDAGDKALVFLAGLFKSSLRHTDYVFRWGGEEFLIVMINLDLDMAFNIIDSIRKKIEKSKIEFNGKSICFTITAGIAKLKDKMINETIAQCDENLYIGKRSGKNMVVK